MASNLPLLNLKKSYQLTDVLTSITIALAIVIPCEAATVERFLEPNVAHVGDLLQLKLVVKDADGAVIEWPFFHPDSLAFHLISVDSMGLLPQERIFNLALYDTGRFLLPPLPVVLHKTDFRETLYTHHAEVEIVSILPDTANAPRHIKDLRTLPLTFKEILAQIFWPLIILLLVGAAIFLYLRYRKKRKPQEYAAPKIILPAHELAMTELIELRDKKYPERGMLREFFTELSEILRRYIERRYVFPALEMTTYELQQELERDIYSSILRMESLFILSEADLVKFAKYIPPWQNCDEHLKRAIQIVEATKETVETQVMGAAA